MNHGLSKEVLILGLSRFLNNCHNRQTLELSESSIPRINTNAQIMNLDASNYLMYIH